MSEEQLAVLQMTFWREDGLTFVICMFIAGSIGRTLISCEPFNSQKFFGEIILSGLGAITLFYFNVMQGMSPTQIIFFGALGSMGGFRMIEWTIKFAKQVKGSGDQ